MPTIEAIRDAYQNYQSRGNRQDFYNQYLLDNEYSLLAFPEKFFAVVLEQDNSQQDEFYPQTHKLIKHIKDRQQSLQKEWSDKQKEYDQSWSIFPNSELSKTFQTLKDKRSLLNRLQQTPIFQPELDLKGNINPQRTPFLAQLASLFIPGNREIDDGKYGEWLAKYAIKKQDYNFAQFVLSEMSHLKLDQAYSIFECNQNYQTNLELLRADAIKEKVHRSCEEDKITFLKHVSPGNSNVSQAFVDFIKPMVTTFTPNEVKRVIERSFVDDQLYQSVQRHFQDLLQKVYSSTQSHSTANLKLIHGAVDHNRLELADTLIKYFNHQLNPDQNLSDQNFGLCKEILNKLLSSEVGAHQSARKLTEKVMPQLSIDQKMTVMDIAVNRNREIIECILQNIDSQQIPFKQDRVERLLSTKDEELTDKFIKCLDIDYSRDEHKVAMLELAEQALTGGKQNCARTLIDKWQQSEPTMKHIYSILSDAVRQQDISLFNAVAKPYCNKNDNQTDHHSSVNKQQLHNLRLWSSQPDHSNQDYSNSNKSSPGQS